MMKAQQAQKKYQHKFFFSEISTRIQHFQMNDSTFRITTFNILYDPVQHLTNASSTMYTSNVETVDRDC